MLNEIWKDIKGWEGIYQVSNVGRVKSLKRFLVKEERIMGLHDNGRGYLNVRLRKDSRGNVKYIHRLVAETFISNLENKQEVNHKNGDKSDNRVENLEWCSPEENREHAIRTGLMAFEGENNGMAKFSQQTILELRKEFELGDKTRKELSEKYGISLTHTRSIINKSRWNHA